MMSSEVIAPIVSMLEANATSMLAVRLRTLVRMDFNRRLSQAMEARMCSRAALAKELQVSVQAIGLVLSGDTRAMTAENAAKAARFLRVDYYWLATGEGSMEPGEAWPVQRVTVDRFTRLSPEDRAYVEGRLEAAIRDCETRRTTPAPMTLPARPLRKAPNPNVDGVREIPMTKASAPAKKGRKR